MRQGLTVKYPGLQLANCWVLNVGLQEPSQFAAHRMMKAGLVTLLAGGVLCARMIWRFARVQRGAAAVRFQKGMRC